MSLAKILRRLPARAVDDPRSVNVRERLLAAVRGSINPVLLRTTPPRGCDLRRTLVVCGFPRSGTTWLAEVLSGIPRTGIVFEPLDIRRVPAAREAGFDWENFIPPDRLWPAGETYLREVLSGRAHTRWTTSHLPMSRARRVDRWVVKFVRANQMLAWMVAHFELPPPILVVRHPCAVYDSWVRRGWPLHQHRPPEGLRFFETYPEARNIAAGLRTVEEFFAAEWAMQHYTPLRQLKEGTYQLCFYERLRADGPHEIASICRRCNVPLPEGVERSLDRPSAKASGQARGSRRMTGKGWRSRLEPVVIQRIMEVVGQFNVNLYGSESGTTADVGNH